MGVDGVGFVWWVGFMGWGGGVGFGVGGDIVVWGWFFGRGVLVWGGGWVGMVFVGRECMRVVGLDFGGD